MTDSSTTACSRSSFVFLAEEALVSLVVSFLFWNNKLNKNIINKYYHTLSAAGFLAVGKGSCGEVKAVDVTEGVVVAITGDCSVVIGSIGVDVASVVVSSVIVCVSVMTIVSIGEAVPSIGEAVASIGEAVASIGEAVASIGEAVASIRAVVAFIGVEGASVGGSSTLPEVTSIGEELAGVVVSSIIITSCNVKLASVGEEVISVIVEGVEVDECVELIGSTTWSVGSCSVSSDDCCGSVGCGSSDGAGCVVGCDCAGSKICSEDSVDCSVGTTNIGSVFGFSSSCLIWINIILKKY